MARFTGVGAGDKKKVAIAAGFGVVALSMAFYTLFSGPAPTPTPPPTAVRPAAVAVAPKAPASSRVTGTTSSSGSLDPTLHPEWMAETESYVYTGSGRNIFSQSSAQQPPAPVRIEPVRAPVRPSQQIVVNPGPPPPPPIDLRFFGYAARKNGTRSAFLSHGDDVFVASEGDVVSHRYRIVHIAPFSIEVEDLPFHHTQSLPLVQN